MRPRRVSSFILSSALAAVCAGGCATSVREHGRGAVVGRYQAVTLTADLPGGPDVERVIAACEETLRGIGYAIHETGVRPGSAFLAGSPPNAGRLDTITVTAKRSEGSDVTHLKITIGPWGDEVMSRAILEDVLSRLGL